MDLIAQWLALKLYFKASCRIAKMWSSLSFSLIQKERDWCQTKVWFARQPVGVNVLNQFMKNMAKEGGLDITAKNFTNHSVQKTIVRKLKKAEASSREQ